MTATTATRPAKTNIFLAILNWIARKDAAYREAQKLSRMSDERLDDMGMTREQANAAFYARGSRRADMGAPVTLQAARLR